MLARSPYPDGVPASLWINTYLIWWDRSVGFPLFGTLTVGIFGLYLLFCTVKGNFKFGVRFFVVEVYPVKVGGPFFPNPIFSMRVCASVRRDRCS